MGCQFLSQFSPSAGAGGNFLTLFTATTDTPAANQDEFYNLQGSSSGNGSSTVKRSFPMREWTVNQFHVRIDTNNKTAEVDWELLVEGTTVQEVTIGAGLTGTFSVTGIAQQIKDDEQAEYRIRAGTDTANTIQLESYVLYGLVV